MDSAEHRVLLRTAGHDSHVVFTELFRSLQPLVGFADVEVERAPASCLWKEYGSDAIRGADVIALAPFVQGTGPTALVPYMEPLPKIYLQELMEEDRVIVIALDLKPTAMPSIKGYNFDNDRKKSAWWDPGKAKVRKHPYICRRLNPTTWDDFSMHVIWVCYPSDAGMAHDIGERYTKAFSALIGKGAVKDLIAMQLAEWRAEKR